MSKKLLFILGAMAAGLGIGTLIGLQQVRRTDTSIAQNQNEQQKAETEDIFELGAIQVIPKNDLPNRALLEETIKDFTKKWGASPEVEEFTANDGQVYFLVVSPQRKKNVEGIKNEINQDIERERLIKEKYERTTAERKSAMEQIRNFHREERKITYIDVSGDPSGSGEGVETYKDDRGYVYEYDVGKKKIMTMQAAGDKIWCEANKNVLKPDCSFKEGQITEQQAKNKASAALTKEIGKEKALEILNNSSMERAKEKGNTFVFFYPKESGRNYQMLVVVEPVNGEIINYQNYLQ